MATERYKLTTVGTNDRIKFLLQKPGQATRRWCRYAHKRHNKIQGTARHKQTRQNYWTYADRVSREEQKQKLPCRCFLPTTLWRQRKTDVDQKLDTILSAITATSNQAIVIAEYTNIDCNKPSTVLETCKEVLDTYNLKTHRSHC